MKINHFYFLVRSWNAYQWFDQCIDSILVQKGPNYTILFVDDASEYTKQQKKHIKEKLKGHVVVFNTERKYSLRNAYDMIHTYAEAPNSIVINVDGDDWLLGNKVLYTLNQEYTRMPEAILSYGDCLYYSPRNLNIHKKKASSFFELNHRYPREIEQKNSYRSYHFIPLHLRTWKTQSFNEIPVDNFLKPDKKWLRFCEDQAIFYPLLEKSHNNYIVINRPLYSYNLSTLLSDNKLHLAERLIDEFFILRKPTLSN